MSECKVSGIPEGPSFGELVSAMESDLYWVRFFARPCCPAPDAEGAAAMLDRLASEVDARHDFSPTEKHALRKMIESRKKWYPKSGLCRAKRS